MAWLVAASWLLFLFVSSGTTRARSELDVLLEIKAALDPRGRVLRSWGAGGTPCDGSFEGVACDAEGRVANVSLQGKGLAGSIPSAMAELVALTGLYLHYNKLRGTIPKELSTLSGLRDLYLNVNELSGSIPPDLGALERLEALQLCCNDLEGGIPTELGALKELHVLALQHNQLVGAIPPALGSLSSLTRLDLSSNLLTGSIPPSLATLSQLITLDVSSNNLSGATPSGLRNLQRGFAYGNNSLLCGEDFANLPLCNTSATFVRPEPLGTLLPNISTQAAPPASSISTAAESADPEAQIKSGPKTSQVGVVSGVVAFTAGGIIVGLLVFILFRRHKQRISSAFEMGGDGKLSGDLSNEKQYRSDTHLQRSMSPLSNFRHPSHRASRSFGSFSGTVFFNGCHPSSQYDLEELEVATNFFSEKNLLGKRCHSSVHKGVLKDGSIVAIRSLSKASCKAGGAVEFKQMVGLIAEMRHENLAFLRGFCCSKGKAEYFLVYDFVSNGTLQDHLDRRKKSSLDWSVRTRIAYSIAKGIQFMHRGLDEPVIHQNVSASNILLDQNYNALLSDGGLYRLLADDIVFSVSKSSAALGYLAPEYATTGRLTEKSDVYAFGVVLMQLLTGKKPLYVDESNHTVVNMVAWARALVGAGCMEELMDVELGDKYSSDGALHIAAVAFTCTSEDANERPTMGEVVSLLREVEVGGEAASVEAGFSSGEDYSRRQQALFAERLDNGR